MQHGLTDRLDRLELIDIAEEDKTELVKLKQAKQK